MRTKSILAFALAALPALFASAADADEGPRLPKGWTPGADHAEKPAPAPEREFGSFQSNHELSFPVRSSVPGRRVDLASLPVIDVDDVEAAPDASNQGAPAAVASGGSAGDVVVIKKGSKNRVSVRGFDAGVIRIGRSTEAAVGRQSEGGLANLCDPDSGKGGVRSLLYEGIRRIDEQGTLEFVWARGSFDASTCRASIVARHSAKPQHIGGGIVYAFRTRCAGCAEGSRDVLHVLTPQMVGRFDKAIPFEHRTLVLAPGKSAAFEGGSSFRNPGGGQAWSMPDWHGFVDRQCKKDTVWCFKSVRFEVSQGAGESSATVFVGGDVD